MKNQDIKAVYQQLKNRQENPRGAFDKQGRFYAQFGELMNVRSPSAAWPYSQMTAARTLKFVKALAAAQRCKTRAQLEAVAFAD